jgi:HEAT repeat protein
VNQETPGTAQWRDELVAAFKEGDEFRARAQVSRLGARKARPLLEAMLEDPDAVVRQAAAFGLGELGGHPLR